MATLRLMIHAYQDSTISPTEKDSLSPIIRNALQNSETHAQIHEIFSAPDAQEVCHIAVETILSAEGVALNAAILALAAQLERVESH